MGLLRILLAYSVVFAHTGGPELIGGPLAVQVFFIISGFLIAHITYENYYENLIDFYKSRALRLFPVYYVVAFTTLILYVVEHDKLVDFARLPIAAQMTMAAVNLLLFGQDWIFFLKVDGASLTFSSNVFGTISPLYRFLLAPQAWSLSLELLFYLVAPLIIRRQRMLLLVLGLSVFLRLWALQIGFGGADPWSYRFFPFEISWFIAGVLSRRYLLPSAIIINERVTSMKIDTIGTTVIIGAVLMYHFLPDISNIKPLIICFLTIMCLPFLFIFQNRHPWDRLVGDLSYPVYIVHMLMAYGILWILRHLGLADHGLVAPLYFLVVSLSSGVAAVGLLVFVARPVDRIRGRMRNRAPQLVQSGGT